MFMWCIVKLILNHQILGNLKYKSQCENSAGKSV